MCFIPRKTCGELRLNSNQHTAPTLALIADPSEGGNPSLDGKERHNDTRGGVVYELVFMICSRQTEQALAEHSWLALPMSNDGY